MTIDNMEDPLLMVPGPSNLHPRVRRALLRHFSHRSDAFHKIYGDVVEMLRRMFHTNGEVHVLTSSGTGAVECSILNFISPNDSVIALRYGTFSKRLSCQVRKVCRNVVEVSFPAERPPRLEDYVKAVEEMNVKEADVFVTVFNETCPGTALRDLERICKWMRDRGAITIVDNVSGFGGDVFEVDRWGIDVAVSASQKCIGAPPGLSFISISSKEAVDKLERVSSVTTYFDLKLYRKFSKRLETPFTAATNLLSALHEALRMIFEIGLDKWIGWHKVRADVMADALEAIGLTPFVRDRHARSNTVLSFLYPRGVDTHVFRIELSSRYGVEVADGMDEFSNVIFRIGNMGYVSRRAVLMLVMSIASTLRGLRAEVRLNELDHVLDIIHSYEEPISGAG